jgi:hypothetical protein
LQRQLDLPLLGQHFFQAVHVPLLFDRFGGHVLAHQIGEAAFAQAGNLSRQVAASRMSLRCW